jgi:hypothetical protein
MFVDFLSPPKLNVPLQCARMHKTTKRSWKKAHARQPSLLALCAFQALLKQIFQVMLALLEDNIFEAAAASLHVAHHGGHLNKLNNNNIIPSKTHNGNTNLRQTHRPRNTHMASLTKEKN